MISLSRFFYLLRSTHLWSGILDVLVVSYLFYRLLLLARGTRAWQILGGIGTLLVALYLSSVLHLDTLNWLLEQVVPLGPVALVILFFPELRHALEEFGPRFWSKGLNLLRSEDVHQVIMDVVMAMVACSSTKTGALVVFERQTGLDEVIANGTPLDAEISVELLETIFFKNTALHDGAVVIRNMRIASAGSLLPLTDRPRVDAQVHTRHKAALGMSENSDAVVVVVSEETGTISIALDGKFIRGLNRETLREKLTSLLLTNDKIVRNLRRNTK